MQRKFNFRLERVLKVRAIEERVARAQWGAAQARLREVQAKLDARRVELASSRRDLGQGVQSGAIAPKLALLVQRALDAQLFGLTSAREGVKTHSASAAQLSREWQQREQDRKALSELEERERSEHRLELEASENRDLDEQAGGRAARRRQTERELHALGKDSEIYSRSRPTSTE